MTSELFRNLNAEQAKEYLPLLHALWQEAHGNWARAHEIAQNIESPDAAWVHAYLHRREGDDGNAAYWYRHTQRSVCKSTLDEEWHAIATALLAKR